MAILHLTGTPLATTQADLTPIQREFLHHAIPKAYQTLHGIGGLTRKRQRGGDPNLKAIVDQRRREGR